MSEFGIKGNGTIMGLPEVSKCWYLVIITIHVLVFIYLAVALICLGQWHNIGVLSSFP